MSTRQIQKTLAPRSRLTAALVVILALVHPEGLMAQDPALYTQAQRQLAEADTAAALASLRRLTRDQQDFAPGWGLLGQVLTTSASGVATDFNERKEAEEALLEALKLDGDNPLYLFTLGQLKRKQQIYLDSRRLLNRAMEIIEENPASLESEDRAELWFQRGLFYEDEYLDTRYLAFVPNSPVNTPDCAALGAFCQNFTRPKRFNEHLKNATDMTEDGEDDFERMSTAFRTALDADPAHDGAFRRMAIHLIDRGDLAEARRMAQSYRAKAPDSPWGYFTLGIIYARTGQDSLAELEFDQALVRSPDDIADHYRDVSPLLRTSVAEAYEGDSDEGRRQLESILWRMSDPLYITAGNETRVAHLERVAYADLMFEDPSDGTWGAETEQGDIYVRYGPPKHIFLLQRDASREMSAAAYEVGTSHVMGGGRWIFWNYGWDIPNFIFQKELRWRHASHHLASHSKQMEEDVRAEMPAAYTTSFELIDYPVQMARFRGAADTIIELDLYTEVPAEELLDEPDELALGIFVHAGSQHVRIYDRTLNISAPPEPQPLTYSLPLLDGRYMLSIEARAPDGTAARLREEVVLEPFPETVLALSDLVLANTIAPRVEEPIDRRGFAIRVNRRLEFEPDDPFAVYWEVYGLQVDGESFANYRVTIEVKDAEGKGVLAKIVSLFGSDDEDLELTYERTVEVDGDRVPEYMSLELADDEPGTYRLEIEVVDLLSDAKIVGERTFTVKGLGESPG